MTSTVIAMMTTTSPRKIDEPSPTPPSGSPISWHDPGADREQGDDEQDDQQDAADAQQDRCAGRRDEHRRQPQQHQLAAGGRRLAEALDRNLEIVRAALGQRERGVRHAPQRHPLLRACGGHRAPEVLARRLGVVALGRPRAEDRLRRGLVALLALELLVGAVLELRDRGERARLLDLDLALFGRHRRQAA